MKSKLAIAVMAQDRPIETDDEGMVSIPDVCGRAWWGFIHGWATTIRDDGCSACGEHAVQFVSALHDLVNIKLIGEGDKDKSVHDPENFMKVARHYHNAVHAAGLECTICDPVGILAPVAQELPHAHATQDPIQRSLFDVLDVEPVPDDGPGGPVDELPIALRPFRFDTRLVRREPGIEYPIVTSPSDVFALAKDLIESDRERLLVLYADTRSRLIGAQETAVGSKNASIVPVDVVARTAILANATGVFVVHNHPSGDATPSDEDVAITKTLSEALGLFEIELVDHIVIGAGRFVSMREKGLLKTGAASAAQDGEFRYPEILGIPTEVIRNVAPMAQDMKVRISGTCEHDGPCKIKVRAVDEVVENVDSVDLVGDAVEEAHRKLLAKRASNVTDLTFAIGANSVTRYQFRFRVVDAGELIVSNDPFTFVVNPEYPAELQPRDRTRSAVKLQVENLARNLNPDLLLTDFRVLDRGAPIVGPDMVVEGGNGRTMALVRAAADFPQMYGEYRRRLIERAGEFGIDAADIERLETPVLVRVRLTEVDRVRFAAETNTPAGISISAIESASEDANNITVDMLRQLVVLDGEGLADSLRATRNGQFVRSFMDSLPADEQAQLVDSGGVINQDGIRRLVLAVFISAFPGDDGVKLAELAFESIDLQIRNVVNALSQILGPLATAESLVRSGERQADLAIAGDLATAVAVFARIKSTPGQVVEMFLNQSQLFGRELTPFQEDLLQFLDIRSRSARRISSAIVNYANLVIESPPPQQATLIPGAELTKAGLWESAVNEADIGMAAQDPRDAVDWCNLSSSEIDDVWSWRPLRELLVTAIGAGAIIEVCEIGFTGDQVQVTVDTRSVLPTGERPTGIVRAAERLGRAAEMVLTQEPGVLLWTVTLPGSDLRDLELTGQVPEPATPRPEPGEQPMLFQSHSARMGQESVLSRIGGATALGVGFNLGGEIARAVVSKITGGNTGKAAQPCSELTPQALKLDISGSGEFVREQIEDPDRFDSRGFRTVDQSGHRLIVGCPIGSFDPDRATGDQCVDGLELQSVLHPRQCVVELIANAEELGIPIIDDGITDEVEAALQKAGLLNSAQNGANDMVGPEIAESTAKQSQQIAVIR